MPIDFIAPLSGELVPLEQVPDPVFAQKMVGDGIAIDPLNQSLRSPCAGRIKQLHPAGHAVTVLTPEGLEVLMHIGLDTVKLRGQGFTPRVQEGDEVALGAVLIDFDLDLLATSAKSVLTLVIVTTGGKVAALEPAAGMVEVGRDRIFSVRLKDEAAAHPTEGGPRLSSEEIEIPNPSGLHARPAAVLAQAAKAFQSEIRLQLGGKRANAKSVTAVLGLDVRRHARVVVTAEGPDAAEAILRLAKMLTEGLGDEGCGPSAKPREVKPDRAATSDPNVLEGLPASPGLGVGTIFQVRPAEIAVAQRAGEPNEERVRLAGAIDQARNQLSALQKHFAAGGEAAKGAIFAAHLELLEDPEVAELASAGIGEGKSAAAAWQSAFQTHVDRLAAMSNQLLAQRANDLCDVGRRVLEVLAGVVREKAVYPAQSILIAEDLTPSEAAALDQAQVRGLCTTRGGSTSHVAILARSLGLPALAGVEARALEVPNGTLAILDGARGVLRLHPSATEVKEIRARQQAVETKRRQDLAHAAEPAVTLDGHRLEIAANIGGLREAGQVGVAGGEGVGLLRSEFLFLERAGAPTEDDQFEVYRAITEALGTKLPLIIRTLDVGGDKPLAYLPIAPEGNPFLGLRGIRVGLDQPEVLRTQLRAILRASNFGPIRLMLPMVGTLEELRAAKAVLRAEAEQLGIPPVPIGIMVEVPSAALLAGQFAREADFFSIGTNDLTQYTLAIDRGHPKLAPQADGLHPAVLKLIAETVAGAHQHGRWVGVCGGLASDPQAVPILLGLGVAELSVSLPAIPSVKAQVRTLRRSACRELAATALACGTAGEVRALVPSPAPAKS